MRQVEATATEGGRVLIIDDDPMAAGMLAMALRKSGHVVELAPSGEAGVAALEKGAPDAILLDIEMPGGMNGYDTCRQLRKRPDGADLTIIFLSAHDELSDRLDAYEAGGDDFVAKPFDAEEVRRKVALAVRAHARKLNARNEATSLKQVADTAMESYEEMGAVLKFTRSALGSRTLRALAEQVIRSMRVTQSECHVQLRGSPAAGTVTMTPGGIASPLEVSVIERMRTQDRIFQFRSRMIVNYEKVSLLVTNMPVDDEALAGRIRDYAAIIAEAAEAAVENISLRADAVDLARTLRGLSETGHARVEELRIHYRSQQMDTRLELERMVENVERMYYQFGLTDRQEALISDTVRLARDAVLALFDGNADFDARFGTILEALGQASALKIDTEDEAAAETEIWI